MSLDKIDRPSGVFARRVREVRRRRGWTQDDLAQRLSRFGFPLGRTGIAKIETGKRVVSIDEALALAAVLSVSPTHMLIPIEETAYVGILPAAPSPARAAREWVYGRNPLDHEQKEYGDFHIYNTERPLGELLQRPELGDVREEE